MSKKAETYIVDFNYEVSGTVEVEARTEEEAKSIVEQQLDRSGVDESTHKIRDRGWDATHAKKKENK